MIGKMQVPGWIAGPLAATAVFVGLGFVSLGFYASGGGLLILAVAALCAGIAAAAVVDSSHRGRNALIVAAYVVFSLAALAFVTSQPLPPGASRGGANVPAPR